MVLKVEQERIKALLKDTITLLCKNGLHFKSEFSVEALIGITLDKEDVVLISINEIIQASKLVLSKDGHSQKTDNGETSDGEPQSPPPSPGASARRRKRKHSPQRNTRDVEVDSDGDVGYDDFSIPHQEDSNSEAPAMKRGDFMSVKGERASPDDVVYIKEEHDITEWPSAPRSQDSYSSNIPQNSSNMSHTGENFDFLGGSLVPMPDGQPPPGWSDAGPSQSLSMMSPPKRSSTVTGSNPSTPSDQSQMKSPTVMFQCPQCFKVLKTRQGLHYHMDLHQGKYRYKCTHCSKGFSSATSMKGHVNLHHAHAEDGNTTIFTCPICGRSYPYAQSLRTHMMQAHKYAGPPPGGYAATETLLNQNDPGPDPSSKVDGYAATETSLNQTDPGYDPSSEVDGNMYAASGTSLNQTDPSSKVDEPESDLNITQTTDDTDEAPQETVSYSGAVFPEYVEYVDMSSPDDPFLKEENKT